MLLFIRPFYQWTGAPRCTIYLRLAKVVLLISILLAVHRTDAKRTFWLGIALFGSAYLGLSLVPSILALIAAFLGGQFSRHLFNKNREPVSG